MKIHSLGEFIPTFHKKKKIGKEYRVNYGIRADKVRIVTGKSDSESQVMAIKNAIELAKTQGLDLVEVGSNQTPPVCRILDYGKFKFSQAKKIKQAKKSQTKVLLKEIRLRMRISEHDMGSKRKQIENFLNAGNKVKISVLFRGREQAYPELGVNVLKKVAGELQQLSEIDKAPSMEGRTLSVILAPIK